MSRGCFDYKFPNALFIVNFLLLHIYRCCFLFTMRRPRPSLVVFIRLNEKLDGKDDVLNSIRREWVSSHQLFRIPLPLRLRLQGPEGAATAGLNRPRAWQLRAVSSSLSSNTSLSPRRNRGLSRSIRSFCENRAEMGFEGEKKK